MNKLYFDYCASAPLHPRVLEKLLATSKYFYANPSSMHKMGFEIKNQVEKSREQIAQLLHVKPTELVFTSGATESNNLAILGLIRAWKKRTGRTPHVVVSEIEHSSVLNCCKQLEQEGVEVTFLPVDLNGLVSVESVKRSLQGNTVLVSIMHVNNETGVVEPIEEISRLLKPKPGIFFHVDGVQGFGKQSLNLDNIDLYTLSGHKIGAPKGIGLLLVKEHVELMPLLYGGEQENGIRPGTTNVPGVLSLAEAIEVAFIEQEEKVKYLTKLNDQIYSILETIPEIKINSPKPPLSSPHIINFSYKEKGVTSAIMIKMLEQFGIIVSSQSACSSKSNLSRVLMSMTKDKALSSSSLRISLHETLSQEDVKNLISSILRMVEQVKFKSKFKLISSGAQ